MDAIIRRILRIWLGHTHVRAFERGAAAPEIAQRHKLLTILRRNQETAFGRRHQFASIRSVADFQRRIPPHDYSALEPYIEEMRQGRPAVLTAEPPLMYAMTSGTTGRPKYIPVTRSYIREYLHGVYCGNLYTVRAHDTALRKVLALTSAAEVERTPAGVPCGAIAGYLTERQPFFLRRRFVAPPAVAYIDDLDARYYLMLRLALANPLTGLVAPGPAALIILLRKLEAWAEPLIRDVHDGTLTYPVPLVGPLRALRRRLRPDRARAKALESAARDGLRAGKAWPTLALVTCWKGGMMALYLDRLRHYLGDVPIRELGYLATEGHCTIGVDDATSVLAVTSHFFEFIPEEEIGNPEFVPLTSEQLQEGRAYSILLTTSGGLYRYHINDIVRVTGFYRRTPTLEFVRKGSGVASIAGEKLTDEQVALALKEARQETGVPFVHCAAAPRWGDPPYYALFLELDGAPGEAREGALAEAVDRALSRLNMEYRQKRMTQRLGPPLVTLVPAGSYERLFKRWAAQGGPDMQIKLPVLSADLDFHRHFAPEEIPVG